MDEWRWVMMDDADDSCLEEERAHAAHFALLLDKVLKVLVDNRNRKKDSSSASDGACKK